MENLNQSSILNNNTNDNDNLSETSTILDEPELDEQVLDEQLDINIEINDNIEITSVKSSKSSNSDKIDMSNVIVTYPSGIVGLHNLIGSKKKNGIYNYTCYINTILQCLFNTPYLVNNIRNNSVIDKLHKNIIKSEDKNNISAVFSKIHNTITYRLYKLMNVVWTNNTKNIRPITFVDTLLNKLNSFRGVDINRDDQHDSIEVLQYILENIDMEINDLAEITHKYYDKSYDDIFRKIENENLTEVQCHNLSKEYPNVWELYCVKKSLDYHNKNFSFIKEIFQEFMSYTLECPVCNYCTYKIEPHFILNVSIPDDTTTDIEQLVEDELSRYPNISEEHFDKIKKYLTEKHKKNSKYTLDQCLAHTTKTEILDDTDKWFCSNCNDKVNGIKKISLWVPSKILIIQIVRHINIYDKRVNGYVQQKISNLVEFPFELNINSYMSEYSSNRGNYTYDLYAVSNQIGSYGSGHHFSYVKSLDNGNWYSLNDDNISPINQSDIVTANAYILFYSIRE